MGCLQERWQKFLWGVKSKASESAEWHPCLFEQTVGCSSFSRNAKFALLWDTIFH